LLASCAGGPKVLPPSTDIDEDGYRAHLSELASDAFEGRKPGGPGEEKTITYLTERFRKLGLKPGNGASYLQTVPLVEMTAHDASLRVAGRDGTRSLAYGDDMVIWSRREQAAAALNSSEMVFVGYGMYANTDVRGKTVVVLLGEPGGASSSFGLWDYKFDEAARRGAAGVFVIHDTLGGSLGWKVVVNKYSGPQLHLPASEAASRPQIEGWLSSSAARTLFSRMGQDYAALSADAARPGFKAVAMGLSVDAEVHSVIRHLNSANIIAVLPGAKRAREYILYTAHWDHLGSALGGGAHGANAGAPAIFNGALDNASGTAGLLMLAQSLSRTRPVADRSIVFLALTAEDSGLLGSKFYVENPIFPLGDTAGVINLDTLHPGGPTRDVVIYGKGNSELEEYARDAATLQGRELRADPAPEQRWYYRSAQFNFAKSGVPALYIKGGLDDAARGPEWGRAQLEDYWANRYCEPGDRYSADWDVRGALDDLRIYLAIGNRLARSRSFPDWYPRSEFRPTRAAPSTTPR
jgi:Zn-dependent M28 family amino/carboxypeptidase